MKTFNVKNYNDVMQKILEISEIKFRELNDQQPSWYPKTNSFPTKEEEIRIYVTKKIFRTIPPIFTEAQLTNKKIIENVIGKELKKGLFIYGACGVGKTRELYGLYKILRAHSYLFALEAGDEKIPVLLTTVPEFISELKVEISRANSEDGGNAEQSINDKIKTENILLLDDLGAEKQTDWVLEILYRLINYRYEQMLPTFFSSNYSLQELSEKIGDRVVSRIVEMCDIVKIEGEDRRLLRK